MGKRKKLEFPPTLKAEDYKDGQVVIATGSIKSVQDVDTEFGEKTIIVIQNESDSKDYGVFCNRVSLNNLIDAFGDEDSVWEGKMVCVNCNKDENYKKKMLVISSLNAQ